MSNERDSWMNTPSDVALSQPTSAPPSRVVPPPSRPPQQSSEHSPPPLTPALQHMLNQMQRTTNPGTSQSHGRVAPMPGTGYGTDPSCTPA
eukprot:1370935-Amphidinium_carterae.3